SEDFDPSTHVFSAHYSASLRLSGDSFQRRSLVRDADQLLEIAPTLDRGGENLADVGAVDFVLDDPGLEVGEFLGLEAVLERPVRDRGRLVQAQHLPPVLGDAAREFLAVGVPNLWMALHDDPRLRPVHPSFPGAFGADLTVVKGLGVFTEVPDVAILVLR